MLRQLPRVLMPVTALFVFTCATTGAVADGAESVGIVYMLGSVDRVAQGSAVVDLGDVHTLDSATLQAGKIVAVFRSQDGYFRPVGTLKIAETFSSFSTTEKAIGFQPEPDDVVMFVRELSQLQTAPNHLHRVLATRVLRARARNLVATPRRKEAVRAAFDYRTGHPQWVRNLGNAQGEPYVVGRLYGESLADGASERLDRLIRQIDLLRQLYYDGTEAVAAAGSVWTAVMPALLGQTVLTDAETQKNVVEEGRQSASGPDFIRRVRRLVDDILFDRPAEERNILAALIAARLKNPRGNDELWLQTELPQTQFPNLTSDDQVREDIRRIVRQLRS